MRHKGVAKEETRRKMLDAAGSGFRSKGYAGIGVDGLAKAAGVTSGAFYTHFGSKSAAFDAALAVGLDEVITTVPQYQQKYGGQWLSEFATFYLSKVHQNDRECGCAMASLTPEVVRANTEVHAVYEKKMDQIVDLIAQGFTTESKAQGRAKAWAFLSVLIGGLNIARAVKNTKTADEIAKSIITAVVEAAK